MNEAIQAIYEMLCPLCPKEISCWRTEDALQYSLTEISNPHETSADWPNDTVTFSTAMGITFKNLFAIQLDGDTAIVDPFIVTFPMCRATSVSLCDPHSLETIRELATHYFRAGLG